MTGGVRSPRAAANPTGASARKALRRLREIFQQPRQQVCGDLDSNPGFAMRFASL
jgi:hypothetical protein